MTTPLEQVGELYIETRRLLAEYQKLLALVQDIRDGKVDPATVTVDMSGLSWSLAMTGQQFAEALGTPNKEAADVCDAT